MGAWGFCPFDNDFACDWKYDCQEVDDLRVIRRTINAVLVTGSDDLSAPEAQEAIAAADTIARLKGRFHVRNSYTESIDQWVEAHPIDPPQELVDEALAALDRMMTEPSEILELFPDSEALEEWKQQVYALRERLK